MTLLGSMIVKPVNGEPKLLFPECFTFIVENQEECGIWSSYASPIDGILNSLASLLSLSKYMRTIPISEKEGGRLRLRIENAKSALFPIFQKWDVAATVHVGFEILVPALLEQLEQYEVVFDFPQKNYLMTLNAKKMKKFSPSLLYANKQTTLLHSLEAFVGKIEFDRVRHQLINGSMFGSPSSTAAYLIHCSEWDETAEAYLMLVFEKATPRGGMPSAYPTTVFESSWVRKSNHLLSINILTYLRPCQLCLPMGLLWIYSKGRPSMILQTFYRPLSQVRTVLLDFHPAFWKTLMILPCLFWHCSKLAVALVYRI